jgi:hypothetical protein
MYYFSAVAWKKGLVTGQTTERKIYHLLVSKCFQINGLFALLRMVSSEHLCMLQRN